MSTTGDVRAVRACCTLLDLTAELTMSRQISDIPARPLISLERSWLSVTASACLLVSNGVSSADRPADPAGYGFSSYPLLLSAVTSCMVGVDPLSQYRQWNDRQLYAFCHLPLQLALDLRCRRRFFSSIALFTSACCCLLDCLLLYSASAHLTLRRWRRPAC
jgi:hypothetical protein